MPRLDLIPAQYTRLGHERVRAPELPVPDAINIMAAVRRNRWVLVGFVGLSAVLAAAYSFLATPLYQSGAVVRYEANRLDMPQLVQLTYTDNLIGTEMEVLQGRRVAVAVIDSLGLRARLVSPRNAHLSSLFNELRVVAAADSQTLDFHTNGRGAFTVSRPNSSETLGVAAVGDTVRIAGVVMVLSPAARKLTSLQVHIDPLSRSVARFQSALKISRPARDADLLTIAFRDDDPSRAASTANLIAGTLIADRQQAFHGRAGSAAQFLQQQADSLGRQLRAAEDSLQVYQQREHVIDVPQQASAEVTRLARLQADFAGVRSERDALSALVSQLHADTTGGARDGQVASRRLMAFPALLANQSAAVLLGSLAQVETERSQLLIRRIPADADVQILTRRVREIEAQLQGIAESYLQGLSNQVTALEGELAQFSAALDVLPEKELQSARRERDTKVLSDLYMLVSTRLKEAEITGAAGDPTVRIADSASVPNQPIRPRPLINMVLALVLGGLLGITASLARELGDRTVRSRADVLSACGRPLLGSFPRVLPNQRARIARKRVGGAETSRDRTAASIASLLVTQPGASGAYIELFNELHQNLAWAQPDIPTSVSPHGSPLLLASSGASAEFVEYLSELHGSLAWGSHALPTKVVVFTSPLPGEGKSLSAINFALTGAMRGLRTLLIDADLRCGVVGAVFDCPEAPGFAELLAGTANPIEVLRPIDVPDGETLMTISSGVTPEVPGRVLTSERVHMVVGALAAKFDLVVIDTPPVNLLADAAVLGNAADAVLMVVRAGHTQSADLRFATDKLNASGAPLVGALLNDIDLQRNSNDDGAYRYFVEAERYYVSRS